MPKIRPQSQIGHIFADYAVMAKIAPDYHVCLTERRKTVKLQLERRATGYQTYLTSGIQWYYCVCCISAGSVGIAKINDQRKAMKPGHIVGRECKQSSGLRPYTYELRSTYCMIHRMIHCVIHCVIIIRLPSVISQFVPQVANHRSARERRQMKSGEGRARANRSQELAPHSSGTPQT